MARTAARDATSTAMAVHGVRLSRWKKEIRAGDGDSHEHAAVEIRPEREERRQHPDRLRREACLVAQEQGDDREQREREELAAHDQQRLRRCYGDEQEDESRRGISGGAA